MNQSEGGHSIPCFRTPAAAVLTCLVAIFLCSCVTTPDGSKRLDPWEASVRADDKVGEWLQNLGYPAERRGDPKT